MADLATITLTTPIDVSGQPCSVLHVRHAMRVGDLAAVQRYAKRKGIPADVDALLGGDDGADIGACCALIDSLCQIPEGTADQLTAEDFATAMAALGPFLGSSPGTGGKPAGS